VFLQAALPFEAVCSTSLAERSAFELVTIAQFLQSSSYDQRYLPHSAILHLIPAEAYVAGVAPAEPAVEAPAVAKQRLEAAAFAVGPVAELLLLAVEAPLGLALVRGAPVIELAALSLPAPEPGFDEELPLTLQMRPVVVSVEEVAAAELGFDT